MLGAFSLQSSAYECSWSYIVIPGVHMWLEKVIPWIDHQLVSVNVAA